MLAPNIEGVKAAKTGFAKGLAYFVARYVVTAGGTIIILMNLMRVKMLGHYRYYGVTDNGRSLSQFYYDVKRLLYKWLNRRSQKKSFNFDKFNLFLAKFPLPKPKIYVDVYALAGCIR